MFSLFRKKSSVLSHTVPWGGLEFEEHELAPHYAVMGMTNSGKTLTIRMLMKAILAPKDGTLGVRALVYDPKQDFYPVLIGMGVPKESIVVFHPFDSRSTAWDIASDVTDAASSRQFAEILSPPEEQNLQPFFVNATIDLIAAVIDVFRVLRPKAWTLNDVVETLTSPVQLKAVLGLTQSGRDILQVYFSGGTETGSNVISTVRTKLARYETAARLSVRNTSRFSLTEWARSLDPRLILLGTDDKNAATLDPLNRAIILRASQLITGRADEDPKDATWFFVDEARWAGKLDGLAALLLKGRSKGAHVVLGFQDILGLREVYKGKVADELVGQCGNFAVLKLNSPETMAWAAKYFGNYEEYVASFGRSSSPQGGSTSINHSLTTRQSILEQEFRNYPLPTEEDGICGSFATPDDAWQGTVPRKFVARYLRARSDDAGFLPRDPNDQERVPWPADVLPSLAAAAGASPPKSNPDDGGDRPIVTLPTHLRP